MSDFRDAFYADYLDFKTDWVGEPAPGFAAYFEKIPVLADLPKGSRILEIGFGDGQLLRWCKAMGHHVTGVEIVPALLARAGQMGIDCLRGPLDAASLGNRMFDLIVAFDVFEHMSFEEIIAFFDHSKANLSPHGRYLLRFPNGASPFGYAYQASDITHKSILSLGIIKQLAMRSGLIVTGTLNPRPYPRGMKDKVQRWLGYRLQDSIAWLLTRAYYGGKARLEPNLLVMLGNSASPLSIEEADRDVALVDARALR